MPRLKANASLWLEQGAASIAGKGRIELLRAIDTHGSISAAAREIGMSYKAAWDAVDTMNNLAGKPLVIRETGGKGGGGTRLTPHGHELVAAYALIEQAHRRFMAEASRALGGGNDALSLIRRLSMKTSARNQFHGKVKAIHRGAVNDEIELALPGGTALFATITHESTAELGLQKGSDVVALVKAPWVMLATGNDLRVSTRNVLAGTVATVTPGAVNSEVTLALPGGGTLVAIVTNESVTDLALAEGAPVQALINAAHIILAVPA
jgi:molybdate transport system regulatory protein